MCYGAIWRLVVILTLSVIAVAGTRLIFSRRMSYRAILLEAHSAVLPRFHRSIELVLLVGLI